MRSSREIQGLAKRLSLEAGCERTLLARFIATMRAVRDLPAGADDPHPLDDPDAIELARDDDALGQLYQALSAPKLDAAYRASARDRRKFTADEIPAVTQLFTPRWVVEFLLQNTLGRRWASWHPDSALPNYWPWLIDRDSPPTDRRSSPPADRRSSSGPPSSPHRVKDLTILDPACGTMNFGIVAIEMLDAMYREELDRAGRRGWAAEPSVNCLDQIAPSIARHNLFGIDIDSIALDLARTSLALKLRCPQAQPFNLVRADALMPAAVPWNAPAGRDRPDRFGHPESGFDIIVTNPPYLSARNLPADTVARMKRRFPASWRDQYACFIERSIELLADGGSLGVLAMHSFMFTAGYQRLRRQLGDAAAIESIAHFGPGLFDVGNPGTLQTAAIVLRREPDARRRDGQPVKAIRLVDAQGKRTAMIDALARDDVHRLTQRELLSGSPRAAWSYWLTPAMRRAFATFPKLAKIAPPRQGLATTDNARFVRCWWEVAPTSPPTSPDAALPPCLASPGMWFGYVKSGRFCRWFESPRHRVNWRDDGREIKAAIVERYPYLDGEWQWVAKNSKHYFRPGVTYSYLTSGRFSARLMEAGAIFDVAGSSLFPSSDDDRLAILGILNSSVARRLLDAINPTVNFQVGDLAELPIPAAIGNCDPLRADVSRAIELVRAAERWDETSAAFVAPLSWRDAEERWRATRDELRAIERRIEIEVAELYEMPIEPDPRDASNDSQAAEARFDRIELARRWISDALCHVLRERGGRPIRIVPRDPSIVRSLRDRLDCAGEIETRIGDIGEFLARGFAEWHNKLYRRRPVIWALGSSSRAHLVAHDFATRDVVASMIGRAPPRAWSRRVDDGIAANLAPLAEYVVDPALRKWLAAAAGNGTFQPSKVKRERSKAVAAP